MPTHSQARVYVLDQDNIESIALNSGYKLDELNSMMADAAVKKTKVYIFLDRFTSTYRHVPERYLDMGAGLDRFLQTADAWD